MKGREADVKLRTVPSREEAAHVGSSQLFFVFDVYDASARKEIDDRTRMIDDKDEDHDVQIMYGIEGFPEAVRLKTLGDIVEEQRKCRT